MKRVSIKFPEILYNLAFLLYLIGSSITHSENGAELSLWLMTFAIIISAATTVLPCLGIRWLSLEKKGCYAGTWLAMLIQVSSWGTFGYAMFLRLGRNLSCFHTMITLTTLLWASSLLVFIYSRHACAPRSSDDTLNQNPDPLLPLNEKGEQ